MSLCKLHNTYQNSLLGRTYSRTGQVNSQSLQSTETSLADASFHERGEARLDGITPLSFRRPTTLFLLLIDNWLQDEIYFLLLVMTS